MILGIYYIWDSRQFFPALLYVYMDISSYV